MDQINLKTADYQEIVDYCQQALPNEACGIMAGRIKENKGIVEKIYYMSNNEASPERYFMEPEEQFAVFRDMRKNEWELISIFHSHPNTPARPSREDIEMAHYEDAIYSILSLKSKEPVFRGYKIRENDYQEVEISFA
ncbi:MAG: M67 family metallopeptidase [Bacillota bacterium]